MNELDLNTQDMSEAFARGFSLGLVFGVFGTNSHCASISSRNDLARRGDLGVGTHRRLPRESALPRRRDSLVSRGTQRETITFLFASSGVLINSKTFSTADRRVIIRHFCV